MTQAKQISFGNCAKRWVTVCLRDAQAREAKKASLAIAEKRRSRKSYRTDPTWSRGMLANEALPVEIGFLGELAFCEFMRIYWHRFPYPDLRVHTFGDGGADFRYMGRRFDLKTSVRSDGDMLLREDKIDSEAVYVFASASGDLKTVQIKGWARGSEAIERGVQKRGRGRGKKIWLNRVIPVDELNQIGELVLRMKEHERDVRQKRAGKKNH